MPQRQKRLGRGESTGRASVNIPLGGLFSGVKGGNTTNTPSSDATGALNASGNDSIPGQDPVIPASIKTTTTPFTAQHGIWDYVFGGGREHALANQANTTLQLNTLEGQQQLQNTLAINKAQNDFQLNRDNIQQKYGKDNAQSNALIANEKAKLDQQLAELGKANIPYTPSNLQQFTAGVSQPRIATAISGANTGKAHASAIEAATNNQFPAIQAAAENQYQLGADESAGKIATLPSQIALEIAKNVATSSTAQRLAEAQLNKEESFPFSYQDALQGFKGGSINARTGMIQTPQGQNPMMSNLFGNNTGKVSLGTGPTPAQTPANAASVNANSIDKGPPMAASPAFIPTGSVGNMPVFNPTQPRDNRPPFQMQPTPYVPTQQADGSVVMRNGDIMMPDGTIIKRNQYQQQ